MILGGVTDDVTDGSQVLLSRERWALRPGEVVRVGLAGEETPAGFYVPARAIQSDGSGHYLMIANPSGAAHQASRVDVNVGETIGRIQRIEPVDEGRLQDGALVIVEGAHYVVEGDDVRPVDEVAAAP